MFYECEYGRVSITYDGINAIRVRKQSVPQSVALVA